MRLPILIAVATGFVINFAHAKETAAVTDSEQVSPAAVLRELNLARENPNFTQPSPPNHVRCRYLLKTADD